MVIELTDNRSASTASVSSSILAYRKLHGRTFHNFQTSEDYWYNTVAATATSQ